MRNNRKQVGCNPSLFPSFPEPRTVDVALEIPDKWATEQANLFHNSLCKRYPLSPAAFLEVDCRYRLARLFESHRKVVWRYFSVEDAEREAPRLRQWRHQNRTITLLVEQLRQMGSTIVETVSKIVRIKRDERAAASEPLKRITLTPLPPSLGRCDHAEWLKEKVVNLARQVARRIFGQRLTQAVTALPPTQPSTRAQLFAVRLDRYKTPDAPTAFPFTLAACLQLAVGAGVLAIICPGASDA